MQYWKNFKPNFSRSKSFDLNTPKFIIKFIFKRFTRRKK